MGKYGYLRLALYLDPDTMNVIDAVVKKLGYRYAGDFLKPLLIKAINEWICENKQTVASALIINGFSKNYVESVLSRCLE